MASTYENDLRLEEMATGENSGSWGTKTNTNLELVADAFSYGTEIIADADTAITIADGAADAARSLALKINSSEDLTTTRVVTLGPNTTSKVWIIENNTSGGQTLTISAGSGSNITLANGTTKIIATDGIGAGSNVVELTQDIAIADMSVDGILSLADGTNSAPSLTNTGDTNTGLYFPAADEVGITVGGTQRVKVDSTGVDITGALGVDGDFDVNTDKFTVASATGNTAVAGTLGVTGITTATGGLNVDTISEITAAGGVTVDGVLLKDGGATLTGDLTVDTDTLYVDSTNNRVGIGTTSASSFSVGDLVVGSGSGARGITIYSGNASGIEGIIRFADGVTGDEQYRGQIKYDQSTDIMKLLAAGTGGTTPNVQISNTETMFNEGGLDRDFRVESDSNTHMLFVDAGNNSVSIGESTDAPNATLEVKGGVTMTAGWDRTLQVAGDSSSGFPVVVWNSRNTGYAGIGYDATNTTTPMKFWTGATTSDITLDGQRALELGISGGEAVFNQDGEDIDFRVESDGNANMLFVDAGNNHVNIGTASDLNGVLGVNGLVVSDGASNGFRVVRGSSAYYGQLYVNYEDSKVNTYIDSIASTSFAGQIIARTSDSASTITEQFKLTNGVGAIFNESGADLDFRVESDSNANAFVVDAGTSIVLMGASSDVANNSLPKLSVTTPWKESSNTGYDGTLSLVATGGGSTGGRGPQIIFTGEDGTSARTFAKIDAIKENSTSGDHDGGLIFRTRKNGSSLPARLHLLSYAAIFNDDSDDTDFIVESVSNTNMLFVDAGENTVSVGTASNTNQGHDLAINKSYGITGQTTKTYTTTVGMGGSATVVIGTFTGVGGNTCTAHLIGGSHYSTASTGTSAPVGLYNLMAVTRLDGTGSVYSSINNVEVVTSTKGSAIKPTFEFTSAGVLRVVTATNQGFYGQISVMHHGTFTPA